MTFPHIPYVQPLGRIAELALATRDLTLDEQAELLAAEREDEDDLNNSLEAL